MFMHNSYHVISDKIQVQDSLPTLHVRGLELVHPEMPRVLPFDVIHHVSEKRNPLVSLLEFCSLFFENRITANHIRHLHLLFKEESCV